MKGVEFLKYSVFVELYLTKLTVGDFLDVWYFRSKSLETIDEVAKVRA